MRISQTYPRVDLELLRNGERGTALMEFLFALPFLFFVLILSLNFAKAFLLKQRAIAAVRYVAFADVHHHAKLPDENEVSRHFFHGENVRVISPPSDQAAQALARSKAADPEGNLGQIPEQNGISGFFNSLSGTNSYEVRLTYSPVFARGNYWGQGNQNWFPQLPISSRLIIDSKDWRHPDVSFWKLLKDVAEGGLGKLKGIVGL